MLSAILLVETTEFVQKHPEGPGGIKARQGKPQFVNGTPRKRQKKWFLVVEMQADGMGGNKLLGNFL